MKYIEKTKSEPAVFAQWKKAGGWDASFHSSNTWNPKAEKLKQQIHELLLKEQSQICCYCEDRITEENSHIEHLQPRCQFPKLKEDYANLLCSCNYDRSCGRHKDRSTINVFPLQKACGNVFEYKDNGKIEGKTPDAADTIHVLGLNCEKLNATRNGIIAVFLSIVPEDITVSDYDDWIDDYLKPDANGHSRPFWSTVKSMAKAYRP